MKVRFETNSELIGFAAPLVLSVTLVGDGSFMEVERSPDVWEKITFAELYAEYRAAEQEAIETKKLIQIRSMGNG